MRRIVVLLAVSLGCLFGCGGLPLSPLTNERRQVHLEHDPSKTLTVATDMLFYDASRPHYGIRFPAGIYVLEAQDNEYWYLRGSLPLEFKEYKKGGTVDARRLPGRDHDRQVLVQGRSRGRLYRWRRRHQSSHLEIGQRFHDS